MEKVHPSPHEPPDKAVKHVDETTKVVTAPAAPADRPYETETLLRPTIDQFTEAEVNSFIHLSEFARPNPRKIKRITNTYILARLLLPPDADLRYKTLAWIMLCEQWPVRVAWIMQVIKDNQQLVGEASAGFQSWPLYEYYLAHVEKLVFALMGNDTSIKNQHIRRQYVDAYAMDFDPDLFEVFLSKVNLTVGDVGGQRVERPRSKLCSYSISLSPGIRALVARISSHRIQTQVLKRLKEKEYSSLTVLSSGDYHSFRQRTSQELKHADPATLERRCWSCYFTPDEEELITESKRRTFQHAKSMRHEEAKRSFRADPVGKDFVQYSDYAQAIAQLVVNLVEAPCVFGLSGVWGTGKSFTMTKIVTYVKACSISQLIHMHGEDDEHYALLRKIAALAGDDDKTKLIYKWLMTGGDLDAIRTGEFPALDSSVVNKKWDVYKASVGQASNDDYDIIGLITSILSFLTFIWQATTWSCRRACKTYVRDAPLELLRKAWMETKCKGDKGVNYEFVWFNAWTFCSGSESLWAGLVLKLHEGTERHFGPSYSHAEYRASMIVATGKLLIAMLFAILGVILLGPTDWAALTMSMEQMAEDTSAFTADVMQKFAGLSVFGFSLAAWAKQGLTFFSTPSTPSRSLRERASKFKGRLGFMDEVKKEIDFLSYILTNPKEMPTCWDLIVPSNWPIASFIVKRLKRLLWKPPNKSPRKCRMVICVDDLDRLPPDKIVEVLQAMVLINDNTPFITFLASDPRILVNAIETNYKGFYRESGVTGFEYIEKMIQVPFSFPPLSELDKGKLFRGFLTGKPETDHVEFLDMEGARCCYHLSPDKSGITVSLKGRPNGEEDFTGPVIFIKFAKGVLYNGYGSSRLPSSIAESLVRQLTALAARCDPPVPVQLGDDLSPDESKVTENGV